MSIRPCPSCHASSPRFLPATSQHADVNYYRCDPCGHVWTIPKSNPDGPPHHITPRRVQASDNRDGGSSATS